MARKRRAVRILALVLVAALVLGTALAVVLGGDSTPTPEVAGDPDSLDDPAADAPLDIGGVACDGTEPAAASATKPEFDAPPDLVIDPDVAHTAVLTTSCGTITIELFAAESPQTVNNFVFLARQGFYDGVTFHRIVPGFVIQGGDPTGTGTGGPGYRFEDEPVKRRYQAGTVAMANAGPNTNGSQFFITLGPTPHLDNRHSVFGEVVEGLDVVKRIGGVPTGRQDRPVTPVVMNKVTIERVA